MGLLSFISRTNKKEAKKGPAHAQSPFLFVRTTGLCSLELHSKKKSGFELVKFRRSHQTSQKRRGQGTTAPTPPVPIGAPDFSVA